MIPNDKYSLGLSMCKRSLVAEFHQAFGKEMTETFIKLFGGTYLRVPTAAEMERNLRDINIYQHLAARPHEAKQIISQYGLTQEKLETIYKKVSAEALTARTIPPGLKRRPRLAQLPEGFVRKPRT